MVVVARRTQLAPGTTSTFGSDFGGVSISDNGKTVFYAIITGPANSHTGIWSDRSGTLSLVARTGTQAPGTPSGATFDRLGDSTEKPVINSQGFVAFHGTLDLGIGGVTESNNKGVWAEDVYGALRLVVREGDLFSSWTERLAYCL